MALQYTVSFVTRSGCTAEESFSSPMPAFRFYLWLDAPRKSMDILNRSTGDRLPLESSGSAPVTIRPAASVN